jgi:hypothetical protein
VAERTKTLTTIVVYPTSGRDARMTPDPVPVESGPRLDWAGVSTVVSADIMIGCRISASAAHHADRGANRRRAHAAGVMRQLPCDGVGALIAQRNDALPLCIGWLHVA